MSQNIALRLEWKSLLKAKFHLLFLKNTFSNRLPDNEYLCLGGLVGFVLEGFVLGDGSQNTSQGGFFLFLLVSFCVCIFFLDLKVSFLGIFS